MMQRVGIGAVGGFIATGAMDLFITRLRRLGVLHTFPPEEIAGRAREAAEVPHDEGERRAVTAVAHYGFGATAGAAFGLMPMPRKQFRGPSHGNLVRITHLAGQLCGLGSKLGLRPPPSDDPPESQASIAAGHAVNGAALSAAFGPRST